MTIANEKGASLFQSIEDQSLENQMAGVREENRKLDPKERSNAPQTNI